MANSFWCFAIVLAATLGSTNCQNKTECCEEYCYESDSERPQLAHFATKTVYKTVSGSATGQYEVPDCTPVKIWMLNRHGTRLPKARDIKGLRALESVRNKVITNYEKRKPKSDVGGLCKGDLELLKKWRWNQNITKEYDEFLSDQGWNDLKFLAFRYQRVLPNIFENIYSEKKFLFRYSNTQRTEASFKGFVEGLFGEKAYENIKVSPPEANDTLLRPYKHCALYDKRSATSSGSEYAKFEKSQIFTQLVNDVSMRLGFKKSLKKKKIGRIFDMCRFDQAWEWDAPSPWCVAFTPNQINVLEYREDLKYFYTAGYGRSINANMQCEAVADMLKNLESRDVPNVVAYFSHATAMQLFLTALGAAQDAEALRADNYHSMAQRKWRSSVISPFAANFAAVKYECPKEDEQLKVKFFLNEKPLDFSWCKDGLCNWSDVREMYKRFSQGDCASTYCSNAAAA